MKQKHLSDFLSKLELLQDDTALRWVAEQNNITMTKFARSGRFQDMQQTILRSLNDQEIFLGVSIIMIWFITLAG